LAEHVQVVPPGIDPQRFMLSDEDRTAALARHGAGPNVVFVGRLRYYKGLDVLLRALVHLDSVRLLVAGTGPMEETWRALAFQLGLASRVSWLGDVPEADLPGVYAAGSVFVLPAVARSEAFGIVQLEAMAAGLPVVTTDVGTGTSFVTVHGATGLVVPPDDPEALSDAIAKLLDDPTRASQYGAAGRRRVEAEFTEERMVDAVDSIYREVVHA
jgi:rhamnosyl/mannosyltransferase